MDLRVLQDAAILPLQDVDVNFQSLPRWNNVCCALEAEANGHQQADRYPDAYKCFYRLAFILLKVLPSHRDYDNPSHRTMIADMGRSKASAVSQLESLEGKLTSCESCLSGIASFGPPAASAPSSASVYDPLPTAKVHEATLAAGAPAAELRLSRETSSSVSYPLLSELHLRGSTAEIHAAGATVPQAAAPPDEAPSYADLRSMFARPSASPASRPTSSASCSLVGMRRVCIPGRLVDSFYHLALPNCSIGPRGLETCGVLAGRVDATGKLAISHLVLPKQRGGPDHCEVRRMDSVY
jgi:hypothetical protein